MQANSYLRQSMQGRCRVFFPIMGMQEWVLMGKRFSVFW